MFTPEKRSAVMAAIRSHGNKDTELRLIAIFRAHGIAGWRRGAVIRRRMSGGRGQKESFSVRPDFVFPKLRVAIFVDGCFWHGCPRHATWPKNRAAFWLAKLTGNRARDRRVNRELRALGWRVLRIWEYALTRKQEARTVVRLRRLLQAHVPRSR